MESSVINKCTYYLKKDHKLMVLRIIAVSVQIFIGLLHFGAHLKQFL